MAQAGDILRGGAPAGVRGAPSGSGVTSAEAARARANAVDALSRTTQALKSIKSMQDAARQMAQGRDNLGLDPNHPGQPLPAVPNGLKPGGLEVATGVGVDPKLWQGAALPVENGSGGDVEVRINQTNAQAILNWKTFNVGRQTTVTFDQSNGGAQSGQWIAFNKINDPTGVPSQILGRITAQGQVYLINPNGIIFGGASQINLRTLVASSLPINDNLIQQGLLNNRDAQFLFSTLIVPGGSDGTPTFTPAVIPTPSGRPGDVVVQPGALLNSQLSGDGNGGRIMLVGPNVRNEGTISTPSGQTILAAGLQVAVAAHASDDPSLRGLDVWVGEVGDWAGTSTNSGVINALTGSATMTGRSVNQLGAIESTTSVSLNGRIDLIASYGAVGNPLFDNDGGGGPPFLYQKTGLVTFGNHSSTRILPDYASDRKIPGTTLPERSQINVEGLAVHMDSDAMILAPNGNVNVRAGVWPYQDLDGNRTTLQLDGSLELGLANYFQGTAQRFFFSGGQIYLDPGSFINVAGSTDVFVPLDQSILSVTFRGSEFADSPVQRQGVLRAVPLTVDIRRTGVYNGRYWMGTPLGDVTGLAGLVERSAAQLTAIGGNVTLQSGGSVVMQTGATINVSGGYYQNGAGMVQTTRLLQNGHLVDIQNALPGVVYDGIYTGTFTESHPKYGVSQTFTVPWMLGQHYEQGYTQGADGGALKITAPSMALDGQLLGITVEPPRGQASPPNHSSVSLVFSSEKTFGPPTNVAFLPVSPTPPSIIFGTAKQEPVPQFVLADDGPAALPTGRLGTVILSPELLKKDGFGNLTVENTDGDITVPGGVTLAAPALGSISLTGANVTVRGHVSAPGGTLGFKAYAISPAFTAEFRFDNPAGALAPIPDPARGQFNLAPGASLSAAGLVVDDRPGSPAPLSQPLVLTGGKISIESFDATLAAGGSIDVSGGVAVSSRGAVTYGNAGSITILTGKDPGFSTVIGGKLTLGARLAGFSGKTGGTLNLQASLIQIGGTPQFPNTLLLQPDFFRQGGFTNYNLTGFGAPLDEIPDVGQPTPYAPAIAIAPGAVIAPVAENWLAIPHQPGSDKVVLRPTLKEVGQRSPVSLSFTALGSDDSFTPNILEVRGDIVMGQGAKIITDPGAKVAFKGQTVTLLGSVEAPGGAISIAGGSKFALAPLTDQVATVALPTVYLGSESLFSTAGTAVFVPDPYGRRLGTLYPGGTISVSGNIVASAGAVLDVSGASAIFDVHPTSLGDVGVLNVPVNSGLNSPLWKLRSVPVRMDSNGGTIDLEGAQMLFTDATLLGRAGGPTAVGGKLAVISGRFYPEGGFRTSADINMIVTQDGRTIADTNINPHVGVAVLDANGITLAGMGYFAANRFSEGGFDSLDLGFNSAVSTGGNIEFRGPVSITARGNLRVASGGVIQADSSVNLTAKYIAIGQPFQVPVNPGDSVLPFTQDPPFGIFNFPPTFGSGSITAKADLIDIGTLSLQNVGSATFIADGGDIRGNGTLQIAGDLTFRAAQIYPTNLSTFNIFAYEKNVIVASSTSGSTAVVLASPTLPPGFGVGSPLLGSTVQSILGTAVTLAGGSNTTISNKTSVVFDPGSGSVTVIGSGTSTAPLSAGGSLNIFSATINQGGVLRAPMGSIRLGWDGTDFDSTTAVFDQPPNPIGGATIAVPLTRQVTLGAGSVTSVSAWSGLKGSEMLIPFGLSPDGSSWVDPRGVNVTIGGLPQKQVSIAGNSVTMESGSTIDVRGGGDLYGYRWTSGTGGSMDILGTASGSWQAITEYQPGALVTFGGQTWSARVRNTGQSPTPSLYWSQVPESYAVIPGFKSNFAPYAPFNTGDNARLLNGDPGYVSNTLKLGDQVFLEGVPGLASGTYTLLPRRYALLPGALLVTPTTSNPYGTYTVPEGATYVAGYKLNEFSQPSQIPTLRSQFEVASFDVVRGRVAYNDYTGNAFFTEAARLLDIAKPQRMPTDAGFLAIQGNTALQLNGDVLTTHGVKGRGAEIDVSSNADMYVIGGTGAAPVGATVVLDTSILNSWGAENLLIGGLRTRTDAGAVITVRTSRVVLDNPDDILMAPDITLVSRALLTVTAGSSIGATGEHPRDNNIYTLSGDGTLLRVSQDAGAAIVRTNVTGSTAPLMTIGAGAHIAGTGVILDSTYGTVLDPTVDLKSTYLALGSGQISLVLSPVGALTGSVVPQHLVLSGQLLQDVEQVSFLTLRSYRTIDIYGTGTFGSPDLQHVEFLGGGIRGYEQGGGTALFQVGEVVFSNPSKVDALPAPAVTSGTLRFDAGTVQLGDNAFSVAGYQSTLLNATGGVLGAGSGTFSTPGDLTITTPLITGARGSNEAITAGGVLLLQSSAGPATVTGGLGATLAFTGASVTANTNVILPSGQITLHATGAGQSVGVGATGQLNVAGVAQQFYDLTRYSDAGTVTLISDHGNVDLVAGSVVSVAAPAGGGNAGTISVKASEGAFNINGSTLQGSAAAGQTTGSFILDTGTLPSFEEVAITLNAGGFFEQRNLRIRTGDVTISNPGGAANVARNFTVSTDTGSILVTGTIDASGPTGGQIVLAAGGSVTLASGSLLTVHAVNFSSAGKGGDIRIEAGDAVNGVANPAAVLDVQAGSTIDLGVDAYVAGAYTTPGSSAFFGNFTGTLHLRAPRSGNDIKINSIQGDIIGASAVIAEGYRLYKPAGGLLNTTLRTAINTDANNYMNAGYAAMHTKLLTGNPNSAALDSVLVIAPGVEIWNTGDLTLGTAVSGLNTEDWNLSTFRYGPKLTPGILTLRATGDLVFNNTLSDGFTPVVATTATGNSTMWLAPLMDVVTANGLPINTQSWSYRLVAGSDLSAADFRAVLPIDSLTPGKGSILVGEFYPEIPNNTSTGTTPGVGLNGLTANTIRITTGAANRTRFEVIRTGTGDIDLAAGRDVQLRNQFATIYTAGVRLPNPTTVYSANDFVSPVVALSGPAHPSQTADLGAPQQVYAAQWSLAGGDVTISAGGDIGRFTLTGGLVQPDSSRELPNNWLYRRGFVDSATGKFGVGGVDGTGGPGSAGTVTDLAASTTWWIDFSNFFEGIGALGGGNITLLAGSNVINADAVIPTNARMPGRIQNPDLSFTNVAPDASKLLEFGGGDLIVRAGKNIDGGVFYVERGHGELFAGGQITTNASRSPSLGILGPATASPDIIQSVSPAVFDPATWLPTTLFVGKSTFDVSARGDVLLGPVTDTFLLPQGNDNKFWYKTYFNTFAPDAGATVSSFGGSVTHRLAVTLPGETTPRPILDAWLLNENLFNNSPTRSAYFQPWLRLAERNATSFNTQLQVAAPNLRSTAFGGDINLVGPMTLFPSSTGTIELAASDSIIGLQPSGRTQVNGVAFTVWTSASINLSDADPANAPGVASPVAYQSIVGRAVADLRGGAVNPFRAIDLMYQETGSSTGQSASIIVQRALHSDIPIHTGDPNPALILAGGGDITGLTLFSSKATQALAQRDITDVAFYIQDISPKDISIVAAGRDIVPNNPNSPLRSLANNAALGNFVGDPLRTTVTGVFTNALTGDLQISGPGVMEVLAGHNIDLGTEANLVDGTGVGITSIGSARNPNLPLDGASLIVLAGVPGDGGSGPARGLSKSALDLESFTKDLAAGGGTLDSEYLKTLGRDVTLEELNEERRAIVAVELFFRTLRDTGRNFATTHSYATGLTAVGQLFKATTQTGDILTRARDIRTTAGGSISLAAAGGGITMASNIFGNPLTPPGIVTEYGGAISIFTDKSVSIGQARIFTLRGGDIVIWSTSGDIAAGTSPKTVVTAPPTRVVIDATSADVKTDLGGLATGGGIGVLASVPNVKPGDVDLIAPSGVVDAGDAGIRATGNLTIAATAVLNASNIQVGGTSTGVPSAPQVAAPNFGAIGAGNAAQGAQASTAQEAAKQRSQETREEPPSIITVEVLGYGGGDATTTPE